MFENTWHVLVNVALRCVCVCVCACARACVCTGVHLHFIAIIGALAILFCNVRRAAVHIRKVGDGVRCLPDCRQPQGVL